MSYPSYAMDRSVWGELNGKQHKMNVVRLGVLRGKSRMGGGLFPVGARPKTRRKGKNRQDDQNETC